MHLTTSLEVDYQIMENIIMDNSRKMENMIYYQIISPPLYFTTPRPYIIYIMCSCAQLNNTRKIHLIIIKRIFHDLIKNV